MSKLILSIDGGGIRGAATTQFLSHVETLLKKQHKKFIR
ncbi:MAG TPA: patatin, partial [Gammaproteobacteria bacterium]|nr:patatin [Gammaproteobacteria bacterium]